jgi:ATP synthase protein I
LNQIIITPIMPPLNKRAKEYSVGKRKKSVGVQPLSMKGIETAANRGARIGSPPVHRIMAAQLLILLIATLLLIIIDKVVAYSAGLGGLIAILPHTYFAISVFRHRGAKSASAIAKSSYRGEVGKYVLTCIGFALLFSFVKPVIGLAVFGGFCAMLVIQITGAWFLLGRHPHVND